MNPDPGTERDRAACRVQIESSRELEDDRPPDCDSRVGCEGEREKPSF